MNKKIIKIKNHQNIFFIFMFLSFFQIIFFPFFLKNFLLKTLYKPLTSDKIERILIKTCSSEKAKTANITSIIYLICNKEYIN